MSFSIFYLLCHFGVCLALVSVHEAVIRIHVIFICSDWDLLDPVFRSKLEDGANDKGSGAPYDASGMFFLCKGVDPKDGAEVLNEHYLSSNSSAHNTDEVEVAEDLGKDIESFGTNLPAIHLIEDLQEYKDMEVDSKHLELVVSGVVVLEVLTS